MCVCVCVYIYISHDIIEPWYNYSSHAKTFSQSQLFDGLEEEESSFGNDTFVPRRSIKRLVLKGSQVPSSRFSESETRLDDDLQLPSPVVDRLNSQPG